MSRFRRRDDDPFISDTENENLYNTTNENNEQLHLHEYLGTVRLSEFGEERHNHRLAGVTLEAIPVNGTHIHRVRTATDFFDHYHIIDVRSGPAIAVGQGKHVHLVSGMTSFIDGHRHNFTFATLIESPLL